MKWPPGTENSLAKKVASGQASKAEDKKLVELYTGLAADKPTQGDIGLWKGKDQRWWTPPRAWRKGKPGAKQDLKKAMNCGDCHKVFKPKKG